MPSWQTISFLLCLIPCIAAQGSPEDYAPNVNVACPTGVDLVREFTPQNQSLNPSEAEYIASRESLVLPGAFESWIGDGSDIGYNLSQLAVGNNYSRIGIAISGGGYRAAQYGAGVLSGLDARNDSAKAAGVGGLLQVTSYISALSGGSWLTGSLFFNDWPTIPDLVLGNGGNLTGWILDLNLASPNGQDVFNEYNQYFYGSILWSVLAKAEKAIYTSITDPWARMISYHFLNQTTRANFFTNDSSHGAGQLWSDVPSLAGYQAYKSPFPILMADSRPVGSNLTTLLSPEPVAYEITPLEFGSYDPNLSAMVNITYAGTHLTNGEPANASACVTGFDEVGFMMGTSASLFNQILDTVNNDLSGFDGTDAKNIIYLLQRQLRDVRTIADDVANWPNPFNGIKPTTFEDSNSTWLELIDGSSNAENVPLGPLFVKSRALDVIIAVDGSADEPINLWPNGSSPLFSSRRMASVLESSHQGFPPIPASPDDFISTGVNQHPTFFGCDPTQSPPEWPLLIYLPNSPPINGDAPVTNTKTFKISYTPIYTQLFLDQVHLNTISGFSPNSTSPDPNWGKCLQCAAVDRMRLRVTPATARSSICSSCFKQYCYDPNSPPSSSEIVGRNYVNFDPDPQGVSAVADFLGEIQDALIGGFVGLLVFLGLLVAGLIWWRKRRERDAQYKRVNDFHDGDAPWRGYTDNAGTAGSYELPAHRGSLYGSGRE